MKKTSHELNTHNCEQRERLVSIEKNITELRITNRYQNEELKKLETALKECTYALNKLCNELSESKGGGKAIKWVIPVGLTILTIILTKILYI